MTDRKLVVFDFDGTLVDSHSLFQTSLIEFSNAHNLPYDLDKMACGWVDPQKLDLGWCVSLDRQPDLINAYYTYLNDQIEHERRFIPDPFEDVLAMLTELEMAYDLAIVTARNRRSMQISLETHDMARFFPRFRTHCCTRERNYAVKPAPDALLCLAKETGHNTQDIIMIGDTTYDIDMANAASVRNIAVLWGSHSSDKLSQSKPTRMAKRVNELPCLVEELLSGLDN